MRKLKTLWKFFNGLRVWHLNRWADSLLREAEYHKSAATHHSYSASLYWSRASDVRALARRVQAAGM